MMDGARTSDSFWAFSLVKQNKCIYSTLYSWRFSLDQDEQKMIINLVNLEDVDRANLKSSGMLQLSFSDSNVNEHNLNKLP